MGEIGPFLAREGGRFGVIRGFFCLYFTRLLIVVLGALRTIFGLILQDRSFEAQYRLFYGPYFTRENGRFGRSRAYCLALF